MRAISLIISLIVLVALYECKVVEKGKLMVKSLKTEETWNKSFEKARLGKTKSEGEKKAKNEGHEKLRARILNRLNDISGPLSWTKTKGTLNNSKTEYSWIKSLKKFLLGEQLLDNDLTMNKEELEKLGKIMNRYNRVGNTRLSETKAERMKMVNKSNPEDISLVEETHKENGQVEEHSFAKFMLQKLNSFWEKVIKYIKIKESDGRVLNMLKPNRGHLFMG